MGDPAVRPERRLFYCAGCASAGSHERVRDRLYRCLRCFSAREVTGGEQDFAAHLDPLMPCSPPSGPRPR